MSDDPKMRLQGELIAVVCDAFKEHFTVLLDAYATTVLDEAAAECRNPTPDAIKLRDAVERAHKAWDDAGRPVHTPNDEPQRQGNERNLINQIFENIKQCVSQLGCDGSGDHSFATNSISAGVGCYSLHAFRE